MKITVDAAGIAARPWHVGGSNRLFESPRFVPQVAVFRRALERIKDLENGGVIPFLGLVAPSDQIVFFLPAQVTITAEAGSLSLVDQIVFFYFLDLYHSWLDFGP